MNFNELNYDRVWLSIQDCKREFNGSAGVYHNIKYNQVVSIEPHAQYEWLVKTSNGEEYIFENIHIKGVHQIFEYIEEELFDYIIHKAGSECGLVYVNLDKSSQLYEHRKKAIWKNV